MNFSRLMDSVDLTFPPILLKRTQYYKGFSSSFAAFPLMAVLSCDLVCNMMPALISTVRTSK